MSEPVTATAVLHKPTATIQLSNPFGFGERKLLNTLMYRAQTDGRPLEDAHEIPLTEVCSSIGWRPGKGAEEIKGYLLTLLGTVIQWNEYGADRRREWIACQFLSVGEIVGGTLRYRINPAIAEELADPELYAKIGMLVQAGLSRTNSLVLYEFLEDALARRQSLEAVPIMDLVAMLALSPKTYGQYKYLRRDVLKPGTEQINRSSDLSVAYAPVVERRGVPAHAVCFEVRRRRTLHALGVTGTDSETVVEPVTDPDLADRLRAAGVGRSGARSLCAKHPAERIERQLALLETELGAGTTIRKRGAWLRTAIEEDWAAGRAVATTPPDGASPIESAAEDADRTAEERLRQAFGRHRLTQAKRRFEARSATFRTRRRNAYVRLLEEQGNETVLAAIHRKGWDNTLVNVSFFSQSSLLDDLLVEDHETSLEKFASWRAARESGASK